MESEFSNMTLRDYLRVLFRQKAVVLTAILTVTITVFIGLKFKTAVYEGQVKVLVSAEKQVESPYYRDLVSSRNTEVTITQGEIVKSSPVIEQTVKALALYKRPFDYEAKYCSPWKKPLVEFQAGLQLRSFEKFPGDVRDSYLFRMAVEDLKSKVKVEPIRDTNTFTITVRDFDPVGAATIANTLSRAFLIYDLQQQLAEIQLKYGDKHPTVMQLMDNIGALAQTLHGQPVSTADALGTASSKVVEQANVPIQPVGISKVLSFLLGFVMSVFLGVMLAFVFDYMDHTFKTSREIETELGLQLLGSLPRKQALQAHARQTFADQMYLLMKDKGLKTVMLTGACRHGASAAIALDLAQELAAKASRKVLLIDADLRHPKVHTLLQLPAGPGLAEILEGRSAFEASVKKTGKDLSVLLAGRTELNPVTLTDSGAMHNFLKTVKERYDMIFIQGPTLMPHKDCEILSSLADGTLLVVTEGKTRRAAAKAGLQPLRERKANLLGVVLNDRTFPIPKFLYERI